jgi:hypothetical protein
MKPRLFYCNSKRVSEMSKISSLLRDEMMKFVREKAFLKYDYENLTPEQYQDLKDEKIEEYSYMLAILNSHVDRNKFFNCYKKETPYEWNNELEVPIDIYNKYMTKVIDYAEKQIEFHSNFKDGLLDEFNKELKVSYKMIQKMFKHRNEQEKQMKNSRKNK